MTFDYLHDPDAISAESFRRLAAEADFSRFPGLMKTVAQRVVHASALPAVADDLVFSIGAAEAGQGALRAGATIWVDATMVAHGITRRFLPGNNAIHCTLADEGVTDAARTRSETRSAIAVERWADGLAGSVCVIGNAPTALFRLLEMLDAGAAAPALIIGFPVGFVGAAESKAALVDHAGAVPFITLAGRLGGSAMAAAVVNALALGETP